ncbi:MAG: hypothetical protein VX899_20920 [Myxococcota bacterium]|nr:hypothetical protein [Myxococcota bacterium]
MIRRAKGRAGDIDLGKVFFLLVFASLGYLGWAFLPAYYSEFQMGQAVQESILDWRDRGSMVKAQDTLERRMEYHGVPDYVWPQDCEFYEQLSERHVDCYWVVEITYPLTQKTTELEFSVHKYLDRGDLLHDAEED